MSVTIIMSLNWSFLLISYSEHETSHNDVTIYFYRSSLILTKCPIGSEINGVVGAKKRAQISSLASHLLIDEFIQLINFESWFSLIMILNIWLWLTLESSNQFYDTLILLFINSIAIYFLILIHFGNSKTPR